MEQRSATPFKRLSPDEIRSVYRAGESVVVALVEGLQQRMEQLEQRVQALEARLAQTSSNSHPPPSSDGLRKPATKSLRGPSGRKPGGQPGLVGRTCQPVAKPDRIIPHRLEHCPCGRCGGQSNKPWWASLLSPRYQLHPVRPRVLNLL